MTVNGISAADLLDHFGLTGDQRTASAERQRDVTVTAGAGSGKTRTLVARYIGLLSEGCAPRQVVAITFTEKAAREMRTRVRQELRRLSVAAAEPEARRWWANLMAQMDSARIGTIHSLCAEILRAHPAEAGLDPQFGVAEESETVRLRGAAVEAALLWAVEQPEMRSLFETFSIGRLEQLSSLLLARRLDVTPGSLDGSAGGEIINARLERFLRQEQVGSIMADFHAARQEGSLLADAGDRLADQILRLLALLDDAGQALQTGESLRCARLLWQARASEMALNIGKRASTNKDALKELRALFDLQLGPWLGGKEAPNEQAEAALAVQLPLLQAVYARALELYQAALSERQALDFDDLEGGALALLQQPTVAARWQAEISAVLVDEFQDTNHRQRQLVQLLCGQQPGRLFVVGDARQSIYRFRGADVTVFTGLQQAVRQRGGLTLDLDRTFRAHAALLEPTGSLLAAAMGDRPDPDRPFFVPYAPLQPQRQSARAGVQAPFVECVLGAGEDSETGRQAAARALAFRLAEMRQAGEFQSWDEVTLLFRASTGFPYYEAAFEAAGIPFVTVAGSGFYDRPEIRDLINLLRAVSDPWDDQALAGLLRSPAVGVSDPAIYLLRCRPEGFQPLRRALEDYQTLLPASEQPAAGRALALLEEFEPLVDRLPVDELLRRLVARLDVLAVLASSRSRLWRNAGKLLSDARRSGLVRVRAFLEYIEALRDVGAREGEAISESAGAVRLMTIHKAKGLEFPIVVLADAARMAPGGHAVAYAVPGSETGGGGWTVSPDRLACVPLLFRLAKHLDAQQSEAESSRLLYVALTRAQEKLLISGHIILKPDGGWRSNGWLQDLIEAGGADIDRCLAQPGTAVTDLLANGSPWRLWLAPAGEQSAGAGEPARQEWPELAQPSLLEPLVQPLPESAALEPRQEWQVGWQKPPALVIGGLLHEALQRWNLAQVSPDGLDTLLRQRARQAGIAEGEPLAEVLRVCRLLLARLQRHSIWREIQQSTERYQAIPYQADEGTAYVDVLYRTPQGWQLLDYYTGSLRDESAMRAAVETRRPVLLEKRQAAERRLGVRPQALLCFLDVDRRVVVVPVG